MDYTLIDNLIRKAQEVRNHAYAPYSKYLVGCAVLLKNNKIIVGANVENASFPVSICAERVALSQVISKGFKDYIEAICVLATTKEPAAPCGMCRQFLSEFIDSKVPIILANELGTYKTTNIDYLLPEKFNLSF